MSVTFADISHYQATVDLAAYKRAGHDRVALKATEGTTGVDPRFAERWAQAHQLGLARLAYHFGRSGDGAQEWRHFSGVVRAAGLDPADLLVLDSEDPGNERFARTNAAAFTHAAAADGHPSGAVYTGAWYADPARLTPDVLPAGWRRLWLSDYSTGTPDSQVRLPAGWTRDMLLARQYTDRAAGRRPRPPGRVGSIPGPRVTLPGIGPCDASRVLHEWLTTNPAGGLRMDADVKAAFEQIRKDLGTVRMGDKGHPENVRNVLETAVALTAKVDALTAKVDGLVATVDALSVAARPPGG